MTQLAATLPWLVLACAAIGSCSRPGCSPNESLEAGPSARGDDDEPLPAAHPLEDHEWEVIDPYCGMRLRREEAAATMEHRGRTYYFCLPDHRDAFGRDPDRYLADRRADGDAAPIAADGGPDADQGPPAPRN